MRYMSGRPEDRPLPLRPRRGAP